MNRLALAILAFPLLPILAGCNSTQVATVKADAVTAGTLFCRDGLTIAAVLGVNVKDATAETVATACKLAVVAGVLPSGNAVPVPPPAPSTVVPVAVVAPSVAAAVDASKPPAS